jgi:hypothetical protein
MTIPFYILLGCPLRPDHRAGRAALAAIFDIDVERETRLTLTQATVMLAHKLLSDAGVDKDSLVMIFRFFRPDMDEWPWPKPLLLSLNDNRYAVLVGRDITPRIYDYKMGASVVTAPAPLLQASVNLSGLLALVARTAPSEKPSQSGAAASLAES